MGQLIPGLISLLVPSTKKKERNNFTAKAHHAIYADNAKQRKSDHNCLEIIKN
jgi:hypothetical protein